MAAAPNNPGPDGEDGSGFETIHALSSGRPPAAIAIVRLSGRRSGEILTDLAGSCPPPRHASLRVLRDASGDTLDHALVLWFPGPATATGEDLAELHLHGGRAVVDAVLRALASAGSRMAEPGEFTRRALLNGRLDLEGVEGLSDLLTAETEYQRREALRRTDGVLGRRLARWSDDLLAIAAQYEAAIDYDGDVVLDEERLQDAVATLLGELDDALSRVSAERLRDGLRVAIVGPVNAGKSSLFNAVVGSEAAIVSPIAGTTRDLVERPLVIGGVPLVLIDTAGVRDASEEIERIGIDRAIAARASADLIIDLEGSIESARTILVSAKTDTEPPRSGTLAVSAATGQGVADLVKRIAEKLRPMLPAETDTALNHRYRAALDEARQELRQALYIGDALLAAEHVRLARGAVDRLTGTAGVEDMLDALFSRFCLGK